MSDKNDRGDLKIRYLWLLPIVLELFVCNALFWTDRVTGGEPEKNLILSSFQAEGLAQTEAGGNIFQFTEGEEHYLEFTQIDQEVRSIYLDFALEKDTGAAESFSCSLFASDDGDASYYPIPSDRIKHVVVPDVAATKWLRTRFYGRLQKLKIQFDPGQVNPGDSLVLSAVSINRPRKLRISILRILGMELLVVLICLFQRGSRFYGWSYAERGRIHKVCIGAVLAVQLALLVLMFYTVKPYVETSLTVGGSHEQYQKLAEAIADGHVYLNDQVPEWLKQMENPYDRNERGRLAAETGEPYLWDNVYYNGHYYVYFGIVPVLLAYLPYYLIFHAALPNTVPIYICWFVICAAFARLAGTVIRKWFPSFPYILYVCIAAVLPFGIGSIAVLSQGFEIETEMSIHAIDKNMFLENVVCNYRDRPQGSESKLNTFQDGIRVILTMVRLFRTYRPMKFFSFIAAVLAALSTLFLIPVVKIYIETGMVPNFPTLIVCGFVMIAALYSLFSGMVLQTIYQKNRQDFEMELYRVTKEIQPYAESGF